MQIFRLRRLVARHQYWRSQIMFADCGVRTQRRASFLFWVILFMKIREGPAVCHVAALGNGICYTAERDHL